MKVLKIGKLKMIETLVNLDGKTLIKKYDRYYIRFTGGTHEELLCDLLINNEDAMDILADNSKISEVFSDYEKNINWTKNYFVDSAIKDYMLYACHMYGERITKEIEKLNRHQDIKMEFYRTLMKEAFPKNRAITVEGYTAQKLIGITRLTVLGAYNYLIYLREDPKTALDNLKKGLPVK